MQYIHDSFSDCSNILYRDLCRVNMAYMVKLGQLRVNATKQGQIRLNLRITASIAVVSAPHQSTNRAQISHTIAHAGPLVKP